MSLEFLARVLSDNMKGLHLLYNLYCSQPPGVRASYGPALFYTQFSHLSRGSATTSKSHYSMFECTDGNVSGQSPLLVQIKYSVTLVIICILPQCHQQINVSVTANGIPISLCMLTRT